MSYKSLTQEKNLAWLLPRPKRDHYQGGMPLHCEEWLLDLAQDLLNNHPLKLLNLFCGMNKYGFRIDINDKVNPDLCCDAHEISQYLLPESFNAILADPPYSNQEAKELYGTPPLNYKKWTAECNKLLKPGGLLIIYHKFLMPNPDPTQFEVIKRVFVGTRPYHLPRIAIFFRKKS